MATNDTIPTREKLVVALAATTRMATGILMGTSLAVFIGERGSPFAVSMVATAYWLGLMLFAPVWGALADITGRRRAVLVATGLAATLAVAPLVFVGGVWGPIALRWLYAVFAAGFAPVMLSIVSTHGGQTGRGRSIGFFNSAYALGFMSGQLGAGVLIGLFLPAELFGVVVVISLLSTLAVGLLADPTPSPTDSLSPSALLSEIRSRLFPSIQDRSVLREKGLRWLYVALGLRNMTVLGVGSLLPPYLIGDLGVTAFVMGVVLALNPGGQTIFMYIFGRVSDTMGRKPLIIIGMVGSALHALGVAAAILPASVLVRAVVAAIAVFLLGAAYSAMTVGALAFIGDIAPTVRQGELMGLRTTAKGAGGVFGPVLLGTIATYTSYATAFAAGSTLALAAALLAAVALTESRPVTPDSATASPD